tara:strand:- start:120 stop:2435 length:2316 start_codon:yes stop_codon:yes gene_type:complete
MSTIKISELATSNIALTDFFAKADATGVASKNTVQELSNLLKTVDDTAFKGSIAIADVPSENGWYFASESGTYTNCGGLVIDTADNIAIIIVSGTFDTFNKIDIPVNITIDAIPTEGSANAVQSDGVFDSLALKSEKKDTSVIQNYFTKNRFYRPIAQTNTFPSSITEETLFLTNLFSSIEYENARNYFGYNGDCIKATVVSGGLTNFYIGIPSLIFKPNPLYKADNRLNALVELEVPSTGQVSFRLFTNKNGTLNQIGSTRVHSLVSGYNKITVSSATTLTLNDDDSIQLRIYFDTTNYASQVIRLGQVYFYTGIERSSDVLLENTPEIQPILDTFDKILLKENLFVHNKYLQDLAVPSTSITSPTTTIFNFNQFNSYSYEDAFSRFGYFGRLARFSFGGTYDNGGIIIPLSEFSSLKTYNGTIIANWEIYSPVTIALTCRVYKNVSGTITQIGSNVVQNFTIGVNVLKIPEITVDPLADNIWIRLFSSFNEWDNQTVDFGRLMISSVAIESTELEVENQEIHQNLYDISKITNSNKNALSLINPSYWAGKKMVTIGDSITWLEGWQQEIVRAIGVDYNSSETKTGVNGFRSMGVGGSMITPYITNITGTNPTESIYSRADDVNEYSPDLIFLAGGQNDYLTTVIRSGVAGVIQLGAINDTPYAGAEVTSNPPTFYASYMGTVEKLITQNNLATIMLVTPFWSSDQTTATKKSKCDAIEEIGAKYGLKVINLNELSGINSLNNVARLYDGTHPEPVQATLNGAVISNKLR